MQHKTVKRKIWRFLKSEGITQKQLKVKIPICDKRILNTTIVLPFHLKIFGSWEKKKCAPLHQSFLRRENIVIIFGDVYLLLELNLSRKFLNRLKNIITASPWAKHQRWLNSWQWLNIELSLYLHPVDPETFEYFPPCVGRHPPEPGHHRKNSGEFWRIRRSSCNLALPC